MPTLESRLLTLRVQDKNRAEALRFSFASSGQITVALFCAFKSSRCGRIALRA